MEDLELAYQAFQTNTTPHLPQNHILQAVGYLLKDYAQSPQAARTIGKGVLEDVAPIPIDFNSLGVEASVRSVKVSLDRDATQALLKQVPAYNADK